MPYIDTKYLGKCETCRHHSNSGCDTYCDHGEEYSPNLSKIPTADVVEVVRCKDCKYCFDAIMGGMWCEHPDNIMPLGSNPDDFCSYGERRANERLD